MSEMSLKTVIRGGASSAVASDVASEFPRGTGSSVDLVELLGDRLRDAIAAIRAEHPEVKGLYALCEAGVVELWECGSDGQPTGPLLKIVKILPE